MDHELLKRALSSFEVSQIRALEHFEHLFISNVTVKKKTNNNKNKK
jgi:hypothetical protein